MRELLVIALVLACPLMMMLMMRGHRHGGGDRPRDVTANDLRRYRDELDRQTEERAGRRRHPGRANNLPRAVRAGTPGNERCDTPSGYIGARKTR